MDSQKKKQLGKFQCLVNSVERIAKALIKVITDEILEENFKRITE